MAPGAAVNCAGAASCGRQEDGRTPDVNGVVNGTSEHPLTRGSTGQHEQRASRWSDETERTAEPYLGPLSGGFKTGVSSGPAQAGSIPVRLRYQRLSSPLASSLRPPRLRSGTDAGTVLCNRAVQEGKQGDSEPRRLLAGQGLRRPRSADRQAALRVRPGQDQARGRAGRGGAQDQGGRGS